MKKVLVCVLVFSLSLSLFGCSKKAGDLEGKEVKEVSKQTDEVDISEDILTKQTAELTKAIDSVLKKTAQADKKETKTGSISDDIFGPEEDAFVLYGYSHSDGRALKGKSSDTIEVTQEDGKTTYKFTEHVLSCGTHMNGTITEEMDGDKLVVKASFDVTMNSYEISGLVVEYTKDTITDKYQGFLTENGFTFGINEYF